MDPDAPYGLENTTPEFLTAIVQNVITFLERYGWFLLAGGILLFILWPKLQKFLDELYEKREQRLYSERCHKDADWLKAKVEAEALARKKMQEKMDQKVREHQEILREKMEKKMQELEADRPSRLGSSRKSEYLPLSGDSGRRYCAPKRKCPGGGCG